MKFLVNLIFLFVIGTLNINDVYSEVFTSVTKMGYLVEIESFILKNIKNFIQTPELKKVKNNKELIRLVNEIDQQYSAIDQDPTNPISAFKIIKRFAIDWKNIASMLPVNGTSEILLKGYEFKYALSYPTEIDLIGSAQGLYRLQSTYNLNVSDMAMGLLNGVKYNFKLTPHECLLLGIYLQKSDTNETAKVWFEEAFNQIENTPTIDVGDIKHSILSNLSYAYHNEGNLPSAIKVLKNLVELYPNDEIAKQSLTTFEEELTVKIHTPKIHNEIKIEYHYANDIRIKNLVRNHTDKLCRGEASLKPTKNALLRCRYLSNKPFLKIAPIKMEELSLSPFIAVFHDILYDSEIAILKNLAEPKLERAQIATKDVNVTFKITDSRIGKFAWLESFEDQVIRTIELRTEYMTGLTLISSEHLQLLNYGIGGYYDSHHDYFTDVEIYEEGGVGNRIATVLYYMTDVEQGGATVFPLMNLSVFPKKGSAVFWINLDVTGEGDVRTLHTGCPVLVGQKWVANKWIHVAGQEFLRPHTNLDYINYLKSETTFDEDFNLY